MVRWHIDNVMALHKDPKVNNDFVKWTKSIYEKGDIGMVKYEQGEYGYLGMMFKHTEDGKVKIRMEKYVDKVLDEFLYKNQVPTKAAGTPAANYLFTVEENMAKIGSRRKEVFHLMVAQLLFLSIQR